MVRKLRNSRFINLFYGFMALYMLNICIDSPDALPNDIPEDLSVNDQESLIELIVEKVLGYEEAIPEHDDGDPHQDTTVKGHIDHFVLPFFKSKFDHRPDKGKKQNNSVYFLHFPVHYLEIHLPPPEA